VASFVETESTSGNANGRELRALGDPSIAREQKTVRNAGHDPDAAFPALLDRAAPKRSIPVERAPVT